MSIKVKPKKRGRPATGKDPIVGVRFSKELRGNVERWAKSQEDQPSLSEAVRRLVEIGLASAPSAAPRSRGKASNMAGDQIDRMGDASASDAERGSRKSRLLSGPKEFRDYRRDHPKVKR